MSSWLSGARPITIAILAMGGEGGGVLSDWIVALAEAAHYTAQSTSVAGVAQRTGATVYYVELFPPAANDGSSGGRAEPVLSLFPTPGEVDVVIASELMEAGRAVERGFCTPDRTLLIASTNRVYAISERAALGDGRVDGKLLLEAVQAGSKRFVGADFSRLAEQAGSVISASLFGALAATGSLPFTLEQFESEVRRSGKSADKSLAAFALGYEAALTPMGSEPVGSIRKPRVGVPVSIGPRLSGDPATSDAIAEEDRWREAAATSPDSLVGPALQPHARRVRTEFPAASRVMLLRGCVRTGVYQNADYAATYLDRVARVAAVDPDLAGEARLTTEAARHIALWMCYQDTVQVAFQKIRRARLSRVREEARAEPQQLLQVREYLHPQLEEITDTLPTRLGRRLAASRTFRRAVERLTRNGMVVNTTSLIGFTMLWLMASVRPLRPRSLRFGREQAAIEAWLELAVGVAAQDSALAGEIIDCQRVLKGYGETHAHGKDSFDKLMSAARDLAGHPNADSKLARLRTAALADEDGAALAAALKTFVDAAPSGAA
jgi:indolepyruvate ferredoxin oxidoreductase, beta subunit